MSLKPQTIERLPHVDGLLNYLAPMAEKPYNLTYEPAPGEPRSKGQPEPHIVPIHDMRPIAGELSLDRQGVGFIQTPTAQRDFYNEDEVKRVYYPECIRLVLDATGGYRAHIFDHTIRRANGAEPTARRACRASRSPACTTTTRSNPDRSGCAT
jgi:hypothetical protein